MANNTKNESSSKSSPTSSHEDTEAFRVLKDKFNLGNDLTKHRHSINIDNLTHAKQQQSTISPEKKTTTPPSKKLLSYIYYNNHSDYDELKPIVEKTSLNNKAAAAFSSVPSKTPTFNDEKKSTSRQKTAATTNTKESPLFQKIMAKLAEVPDSVLLKSYNKQPSHVSRPGTAATINTTNSSSNSNHQAASSSTALKNISTKSIDMALIAVTQPPPPSTEKVLSDFLPLLNSTHSSSEAKNNNNNNNRPVTSGNIQSKGKI